MAKLLYLYNFNIKAYLSETVDMGGTVCYKHNTDSL